MHELNVHKIGGSCLRSRSDFDLIAEKLSSFSGKQVLVVSALWGVTDRLIRAVNEPHYANKLVEDLRTQHLRISPDISESSWNSLFEKVLSGISRDLVLLSTKPNQIQARNRILASGERLSAIVVANNLTNSNLPSIPVGAEDVGLKIQGHGAMKRVNLESSKLHLNLSKDSPIPVLTGWFGEGEDGEITLLSRGGSDHSASSIAKLISADRVILWKDIKGIQSLNPRWGIPTNTIPYLGYNEAITLAMYGGASVIHPFSIEPLISSGIPMEVRCIFAPHTPETTTYIGPDIITQDSNLKAIGCKPGISVIKCHAPINSKILSMLEQIDITMWSIQTKGNFAYIVLSSSHMESIYPHVDSVDVNHFTALISFVGTIPSLSEFNENGDWHKFSKSKNGGLFAVNTDNLEYLLRKLSANLELSC